MNNAEGHGGSASIAISDYWWYFARADLLEAALRSHVEGAGLALDLGSADGPSAAWFRESAQRTVSLDIDPRGLGSDGVCGSALALPFEDAAFDVAVVPMPATVESLGAALADAWRVIRTGGRAMVVAAAGVPESAGIIATLGHAGFRAARLLGEREGLAFYESSRPANRNPG